MNKKTLFIQYVAFNILSFIICFIYGVMDDSGGAGFGFIMIGLFCTGIISVLLLLVNIIILKKEILNPWRILFIDIILIINIWEISLINGLAWWSD